MLENPCIAGKCKRGFYEISEERRTSLFTFFWKLDVQRRRDWLVRCARETPIKRKRADSNRRNCSYDYFINDGNDHKKVCQKFLLNTLNITQRQLLYILANAQEGMSQNENGNMLANIQNQPKPTCGRLLKSFQLVHHITTERIQSECIWHKN